MITLGITVGEPAGIGPDVVLSALQSSWPCRLLVYGDADVLQNRARQLGLRIETRVFSDVMAAASACAEHIPGRIIVVHVPVARAVQPGVLNPDNAQHVLTLLTQAHASCRSGILDGIVTAPVHKGVINEAGVRFTGHTEWLARANDSAAVLMLMHGRAFNVAMATTHIALSEVARQVTIQHLIDKISILRRDWKKWFSHNEPRIVVLGLNPHAGEQGHLGKEEITNIAPAIARLRSAGAHVIGPVSADTAFVHFKKAADVFFGMYHDQVLPVFKYACFGQGANVTLGLPYIRTSVDHGTATELAGTGKASDDSLRYAIATAIKMAKFAKSEGV